MNEFIFSLIENVEVKQKYLIEEQKPEIIDTIEGISKEITAKQILPEEQLVALETFSTLFRKRESVNNSLFNVGYSYSDDTVLKTYTDLIRYYFRRIFKEETINDTYVSAAIESLVSIADALCEKGLLPKHIHLTSSEADLLISTIESAVKVNLENFDIRSFMQFESIQYNDIDEHAAKLVLDSAKFYIMSLDALFNLNNALLNKDAQELLTLYIHERNGLFDYLIGKYITQELM